MGRRSIEVPGLGHGAHPIPNASLVGPLLASGSISGVDRASGVLPEDAATQVANLFDNAAAVLAAAGGSLDNVAKFTVYVRTKDVRAELNPVWEKHFPDPGSRPARHVLVNDSLPPGMHVQGEVIAWLGQP